MDAERYVIGSIAQHSEPAGAVIDVARDTYKSERRKMAYGDKRSGS